MANAIQQQKRATTADWATYSSYVLAAGEIGVEVTSTANPPTTAPKIKIGNGTTTWANLPYAGGGSGGVNITFSATAPVSPSVGDIWIDSDSGTEVVYINDGTSSQWVEINTTGSLTGYTFGGIVKLTTTGTTTTTGTFLFSSYPKLRAIRVKCQGGGGGSGGCATTSAGQTSAGEGGTGGTYGESFYVAGATSLPYSVGGGGTAGGANGNGGDGGITYISANSTFTTTISGTSGTTTITVGSASGIVANQTVLVSGTGVSGGGVLVTNVVGTTLTVSEANTATVSGTGTFINPIAAGLGGNKGNTGSAQSANIGGGNEPITGGVGDFVVPGSGTEQLVLSVVPSRAYSARGGDSFLGRGGNAQRTTSGFNGSAGLSYGGGASGGSNSESQGTARSGAAGAPGIIIIELYY